MSLAMEARKSRPSGPGGEVDMRATAIERGLKTFQEPPIVARGWGREAPSRLALALGLAIVIALAGAEWQASRSAWRTGRSA